MFEGFFFSVEWPVVDLFFFFFLNASPCWFPVTVSIPDSDATVSLLTSCYASIEFHERVCFSFVVITYDRKLRIWLSQVSQSFSKIRFNSCFYFFFFVRVIKHLFSLFWSWLMADIITKQVSPLYLSKISQCGASCARPILQRRNPRYLCHSPLAVRSDLLWSLLEISEL